MALSIPAVGALIAAGLALGFCHRPPPKAAQQAQAQAAAATAQSGLDKADAAAADHTAQKTVRILVTAQEAAHAVQTAEGADTPIPADVLDRWDSGVRTADAAGDAAGDDQRQPAAAVPAPR